MPATLSLSPSILQRMLRSRSHRTRLLLRGGPGISLSVGNARIPSEAAESQREECGYGLHDLTTR